MQGGEQVDDTVLAVVDQLLEGRQAGAAIDGAEGLKAGGLEHGYVVAGVVAVQQAKVRGPDERNVARLHQHIVGAAQAECGMNARQGAAAGPQISCGCTAQMPELLRAVGDECDGSGKGRYGGDHVLDDRALTQRQQRLIAPRRLDWPPAITAAESCSLR